MKKLNILDSLIIVFGSIFCFLAIICCFIGYSDYYETNQIKEMIDCGFGILLFVIFLFFIIVAYFQEKENDDIYDRIIELEMTNELNENNIDALIDNLNDLYDEVYKDKGE